MLIAQTNKLNVLAASFDSASFALVLAIKVFRRPNVRRCLQRSQPGLDQQTRGSRDIALLISASHVAVLMDHQSKAIVENNIARNALPSSVAVRVGSPTTSWYRGCNLSTHPILVISQSRFRLAGLRLGVARQGLWTRPRAFLSLDNDAASWRKSATSLFPTLVNVHWLLIRAARSSAGSDAAAADNLRNDSDRMR